MLPNPVTNLNDSRMRRLSIGWVLLVVSFLCGCTEEDSTKGWVYRPADHMPPHFFEVARYPVPTYQEDGLPGIDVYLDDQKFTTLKPSDMPGSQWKKPSDAPDLQGLGIPFRAPIDYDSLVPLLELLDRFKLRDYLSIRVLTLTEGVEIPCTMVQDPDCRFYFLFNRRNIAKLELRKQLHNVPGQASAWVTLLLVKDVKWICVRSGVRASSGNAPR